MYIFALNEVKMGYNIYFAPIQGYTDAAFRECFEKTFGGITQYYTPFIRYEKGTVRKQDIKDISKERNDTLIGKDLITPQILPGNADEMKILIEEVGNFGYKRIDINLGCPFPMITRKHKGCGLLPYPEEIASILDVVKQYPSLSFSIKMRLGYKDENEWESLVSIINDTQLEHVTIHARTGDQQYNGNVKLTVFEKVYKSIRHPLIFNGDINDEASAKILLNNLPNLKGIMIGRGLLKNPALALEINQGTTLNKQDLTTRLKDFNHSLIECYSSYYDGGDGQVLKKMQLLWEFLLPLLEKKLRKKILKSKSIDEYNGCVEFALNNYNPTEY